MWQSKWRVGGIGINSPHRHTFMRSVCIFCIRNKETFSKEDVPFLWHWRQEINHSLYVLKGGAPNSPAVFLPGARKQVYGSAADLIILIVPFSHMAFFSLFWGSWSWSKLLGRVVFGRQSWQAHCHPCYKQNLIPCLRGKEHWVRDLWSFHFSGASQNNTS